MKKIISLILMLGIVLSIPMGAMAKSPVEFSFDRPEGIEGLEVFSFDMDEDDPMYRIYGDSVDYTLEYMEEEQILMQAFSPDYDIQISLEVEDEISSFSNFSSLSHTEIEYLYHVYFESYKDSGLVYTDYRIHRHPQTRFLVMDYYMPIHETNMYSREYYTVYAGRGISLSVISNGKEAPQEYLDALEAVADSMVFKAKPTPRNVPESSPQLIYCSDESGLVLRLPENWITGPESENWATVDVQFVSLAEEGRIISYACEDYYASLSFLEKLLNKRETLDNSLLSEQIVAQMYGLDERDVKRVSYGDKEYFMVDAEVSTEYYGYTVSMPVIVLHCVENGYSHTFMYNGPKDEPFFKDFESMLENAMY